MSFTSVCGFNVLAEFVKDLNVLTGWVLLYRKHLFLGKNVFCANFANFD